MTRCIVDPAQPPDALPGHAVSIGDACVHGPASCDSHVPTVRGETDRLLSEFK